MEATAAEVSLAEVSLAEVSLADKFPSKWPSKGLIVFFLGGGGGGPFTWEVVRTF